MKVSCVMAMVCPVAHPGLTPRPCLPLHTGLTTHPPSVLLSRFTPHLPNLPAHFLPLSVHIITHTISIHIHSSALKSTTMQRLSVTVNKTRRRKTGIIGKMCIFARLDLFYLSGSLLNKSGYCKCKVLKEVKIGYINTVCLHLSWHRSSFSHLLL